MQSNRTDSIQKAQAFEKQFVQLSVGRMVGLSFRFIIFLGSLLMPIKFAINVSASLLSLSVGPRARFAFSSSCKIDSDGKNCENNRIDELKSGI